MSSLPSRRARRVLAAATAGALSLAVLAGCASSHPIDPQLAPVSVNFGSAAEERVELANFDFTPRELRLRAGRPYDLARAQLAYGELLRRLNRRVEARTHLRAALETFVELGAAPLVERATGELRASGETARKRDPSTLVDLTPMELKVAHLVSTGLSNKDVAARCWVSPRTVAFHLRNVFAKAGITSRGELARLDLG